MSGSNGYQKKCFLLFFSFIRTTGIIRHLFSACMDHHSNIRIAARRGECSEVNSSLGGQARAVKGCWRSALKGRKGKKDRGDFEELEFRCYIVL